MKDRAIELLLLACIFAALLGCLWLLSIEPKCQKDNDQDFKTPYMEVA